MGAIKDSRNPDGLEGLARRVKILETASPLRSASVTAGRVRIGGTAILLVDSSGGVVVHGSIDGDGEFSWSGVLNADGTITLTGPLTATGETNLNGPTAINGTLDVSGLVNLLNNLTVGVGGKITVAGMTIANLASGIGGITWGTTFPSLYSNGSSVAIGAASTQYVSVAPSGPAMVNGTRAFSIDATSHQMVNAATSGLAANVYVDPTNGRMYRSTSSLRYKKNIRTYTPDPRLLRKVRTVLFDDDTGTNRTDVPGVIAEVVAKNGGEHLVERDGEGRVESVAYDRLAIERTAILAAENDQMRSEIAELRKQVTDLAALVNRS